MIEIMSITRPLNVVVGMDSWSNEICLFVVMMQTIPQRRYFRTVGKFDKLWNFLHWENFLIFSQCQVFATVKIFQRRKYLHSQTAYVHAIMTPYASCNRVACRLLIQHTVSTDMYHNSATQHTVATVYVSKKQEVTGVDGGTKNNWRGRLLKYTDEFNEWTYKCNFCAKEIIRKLTRKFTTYPVHSKSDCVIVS